jgi:ABC-2 type transport system permease protein
MTANVSLQPVTTQGWRLGLRPMLAKEFHKWWGTRRWWMQALLWSLVLNVFVALMLFVLPGLRTLEGEPLILGDPLLEALRAFIGIGSLALPVGVVILLQDEILDEVQSGTAAWILSKPVTRTAFLMAKFVAHLSGMMGLLVGLPGLLAYGLVRVAGRGPYPLPPFLTLLGLLALAVCFYASLTLMLGVLVSSRGLVLGVALGAVLAGPMLANLIPYLGVITPWQFSNLALPVLEGAAVPAQLLLSAGMTACWCLAFSAVALRRFQRMEL